MKNLLSEFLRNYSYLKIYGLTALYFLVLYFAGAWLFEKSCEQLRKLGVAERVSQDQSTSGQRNKETINSLLSIAVFGFSSLPIVYLYRIEYFPMKEDSLSNVLLDLLYLNVWNEVHFFLVHKLMHVPFFMKYVHRVHHESRVPSVWSVYSFHWVESLLLSTVPLSLCIVYPLAPFAIAVYPLISIIFNFSGHCNYRIIALKNTWLVMASRHIQHHKKVNVSFGFVSGLLDALFHKKRKVKNL